MKVRVVDNDGGGFSKEVEVREAMTVDAFFENQKPGRRPEDYKIRVNRADVLQQQVLHEGDQVVLTPRKIEGAC